MFAWGDNGPMAQGRPNSARIRSHSPKPSSAASTPPPAVKTDLGCRCCERGAGNRQLIPSMAASCTNLAGHDPTVSRTPTNRQPAALGSCLEADSCSLRVCSRRAGCHDRGQIGRTTFLTASKNSCRRRLGAAVAGGRRVARKPQPQAPGP